ncbi:MAG: molybdopterin-guanine dinucleotide biosynthesis protein B, partial [Dehalococcoidia bacterium]
GYSLATIKHSVSGFDLDQPGKDSWRLGEAGSGAVVLSSPQKIAFIKPVDREAALEELLCLVGGDFDLVLTEGFRSSSTPKIEVHRKELGGLLCSPEELFAVVTDEPLDIAAPQFSPGEVEALVDLVEKRFLALREPEETLLIVNDTPIPLNPFVKSVIHNTLLGMVSALRGAEEVRSLRISLRRGQV